MTKDEILQWCAAVGARVPPSGVISRHHLGQFLGVHANVLRKWRGAGYGPPAIKMGGQWFYNVDALVDWLNNGGDRH